MNGRLLVIDCATPALSLALFDDAVCIAATHEEIGRGHAEALLPAIAALPDGGRCDRILVDVGPGSFTGVRVGIAAATGLAFAWQVPVQGYGCLDLVAAMARHQFGQDEPIAIVMVGGHGEFFWTIPASAGDPAASTPCEVHSTPIGELAERLDIPHVVGSGARSFVEARGCGGVATPLLPDARAIHLLTEDQRNRPARPIYGRGADAKPMTPRTRNLPQAEPG